MSFTSFVQNYLDDFVSLIFPETCLHCRQILLKNENHICTSCQINLPITGFHKSYNDNPIFNDLKIIENLTLATAYLRYNRFGIAQTLLHELKYRGNYELGIQLGRWYGSHLKDVVKGDFLMPVPIHKRKLKQRGYNQATAICEGLQQELPLAIYHEVAIRNKAGKTQTKRSKIDRWNAIEGVFTVRKPAEVEGKRIIIVDDVVTTGATIFSLCDALNRHNPFSIQVVAIASGK
jgi:ComF family protein